MHQDASVFSDPRTWVVVAFFLFFALFGKRLWAAVAEILDARTARIKTEFDEAALLRQEAEAMLRDAQKQHSDALAGSNALIAGARKEATRIIAAAAAEGEAAAERRGQMVIDRIAAAEKAAVYEVRLAAVELAVVAARQLLASGLTADADAKLIDQSIAQLPSAMSSRRAA